MSNNFNPMPPTHPHRKSNSPSVILKTVFLPRLFSVEVPLPRTAENSLTPFQVASSPTKGSISHQPRRRCAVIPRLEFMPNLWVTAFSPSTVMSGNTHGWEGREWLSAKRDGCAEGEDRFWSL